ncbi:MAG: FAD:protein FMN transferase [Gammaproteobacteria bacterium]
MDRRSFLKTGLKVAAVTAIFSTVGWRIAFGQNKHALINRSFYAMGTAGTIIIDSEDKTLAQRALNEAVTKFTALENKLTKFSPNSDIGRLNKSPDRFIQVSTDTHKVLTTGLDVSKQTGNRFDMGLGNFLIQPGLDEHIPRVGHHELTTADLAKPLFMVQGSLIRLTRPNTMLDLGGIAKGYAVDAALDLLRYEYGIKHALVALGGDLSVVGGQPDGEPWHIRFDKKAPIERQNNDILLSTGSVASSGGYLKRAQMQSSEVKHHIIDPLTFSSQEMYALSTVIGPCAAVCDALATAAYNTPPEAMSNLQAHFPQYKFINQIKGETNGY